MASRVTQAARETLAATGIAPALVTQVAVESLAAQAPAALVTQVAIEALWQVVPAPGTEVRLTQAVLETAQQSPPAAGVRETQGALEHVDYPPNEIWATQVCLEVALPAFIPVVTKRNHSFIGVWMGTGHEPNASFNN